MRRPTCTADCREANGCHGAITCRECGDSCGYTLTPECKARTTKRFYLRRVGVK